MNRVYRISTNSRGLVGDWSRLRGDCSGLSRDLDAYELTEEDRKKGVDIRDLVIKREED